MFSKKLCVIRVSWRASLIAQSLVAMYNDMDNLAPGTFLGTALREQALKHASQLS